MTALAIGSKIRELPQLEGSWSVWSQAAEGPGCYFVVPVDDAAQATGIKYAVIRAIRTATSLKGPAIELVRTDPVNPAKQKEQSR